MSPNKIGSSHHDGNQIHAALGLAKELVFASLPDSFLQQSNLASTRFITSRMRTAWSLISIRSFQCWVSD